MGLTFQKTARTYRDRYDTSSVVVPHQAAGLQPVPARARDSSAVGAMLEASAARSRIWAAVQGNGAVNRIPPAEFDIDLTADLEFEYHFPSSKIAPGQIDWSNLERQQMQPVDFSYMVDFDETPLNELL